MLIRIPGSQDVKSSLVTSLAAEQRRRMYSDNLAHDQPVNFVTFVMFYQLSGGL